MKHKIIHEVIEAKSLGKYAVEFVFDDLRRGRVDLKKYLGKGIFKELLKKNKFKQYK